jgi:hypothetical protein
MHHGGASTGDGMWLCIHPLADVHASTAVQPAAFAQRRTSRLDERQAARQRRPTPSGRVELTNGAVQASYYLCIGLFSPRFA